MHSYNDEPIVCNDCPKILSKLSFKFKLQFFLIFLCPPRRFTGKFFCVLGMDIGLGIKIFGYWVLGLGIYVLTEID